MLPEVQVYHYKARTYSPLLGRFLQTDPAGMASDVNLYAYVGNDPVDGVDPNGMVSYIVDLPNGGTRTCDNAGPYSGSSIAGVGDCQDYYGNLGLIFGPAGNGGFPGKGGSGGGGKGSGGAPSGPQNNPPCSAAMAKLANSGNQLQSFGNGLVSGGVGLDVIRLLGDGLGKITVGAMLGEKGVRALSGLTQQTAEAMAEAKQACGK